MLVLQEELRACRKAACASELEKLGHSIVGIGNSAGNALSLIPNLDIDVLMVDINLKNSTLDGISVVRKLYDSYRGVIIFVSAFKDQPTFERMLESKPSYFLKKPYRRFELESAIEIACHKHAERTNTSQAVITDSKQLKTASTLLSRNGAVFFQSDDEFRPDFPHP